MFERSKDMSRNQKSGVLRAVLVALSVLGAHERAKSAEIPEQATWEQGVAELRRNVMNEPVEYAAAVAAFKNGQTVWPRTLRGEVDGVTADYRKMVNHLALRPEYEPVQNFCDIHTHPVTSITYDFNIAEGADRAYAPPSIGDAYVVSVGGRQDVIPRFARDRGLQIAQVTSAVFDPRGVWYYRTLTLDERQKFGTTKMTLGAIEDEFISKVHEPFVRSSMLPNFNFKVEYEKLRSAYRQMIGTEIRFVSYESLKNEPPCAGPDYVPEK